LFISRYRAVNQKHNPRERETRMRKLILLVLLLNITVLQAQYLKPYFNSISVENGLPEGFVVSSLQDKLGYMWFGTQNGLMRYDGYELKSYPIPDENGVPLVYCSINQLHEDKNGKLWAYVNNNGLYFLDRLKDKFEFVRLEGSDDIVLAEYVVVYWVEDQKSNEHWLLVFDEILQKRSLFRFYESENKIEEFGPDAKDENYIPMHNNGDIVQDAEGKIWLASDSLISSFDQESQSFTPWFVIPSGSEGRRILSIMNDPTNKDMLWIATYRVRTEENGTADESVFYQFNTKTKAYKAYSQSEKDPGSIDGNCLIILSDSLKRIWIGTEKGISLFHPMSGTFTNYAIDLSMNRAGNPGSIEVIASDSEENLWVAGSFNGLFYLDVKTAKVTTHAHSNDPGSLPDSPRGINKLFYDRSGTFWVSLPWRGIAYLDHQKSLFNPIPIEPALIDPHVITGSDEFYVNGKNGDSIFFVNNSTGLFEWNFRTNTYKRIDLKNNNAYNQIWHVIVANDGQIWIATTGSGLFSYKPEDKSVMNFTHRPGDSTSLSSNLVTTLIEDGDGILWIGTADRGLCSFNKERSVFTSYPYISNNGLIQAGNELDDNRVLFLYFDREGILWIGTNQGALNRFDTKTETFTSYLDQKSGFNCVVNIYEDSKWRMWAGTYLSGLFLTEKTSGDKKRFSEQDGLLFNSVFGITEDYEGNIWTASSRGLARLDPESNTISNFHIPVGALRSNDILFSGTDGSIQLAMANSIISFKPVNMKASTVSPLIDIEKIGYTNSSKRDTTIFTHGRDQLNLNYNENKISFQYVALHYANSELNQYAYMLEGYDKEWIQAGTQRSATYTNLSPGKYTFKAKAANSDGVWNENYATYSVTILPPWWRTWFAFSMYGLIIIAAIIAVDRIQRRRLAAKANRVAREKELEQAKEIEKAYKELKATQTQLIQSEKMASLGELTAGIAHEIQNPLNFVNNFSEVSKELLDEMREEMVQGNTEEVTDISDNISQNLEKILHHGKRADAIVKGMLLHSRTSSDEKELTDLNAIVDEYLRLAYHGLRAKDKSFNADFKTRLDKDLPMIKVIPQDIGRVLLNLFNNAFYAVSEASSNADESYKPLVEVSTAKLDSKIEIRVHDNGNGIPPEIIEKIFQPFFTTKPTAEGTGLGLSLSYDIVTKGHGGDLKVDTKEGAGTEFIIVLPLTKQ